MARRTGRHRLTAVSVTLIVAGTALASAAHAATLGGLRVSTLAVFGGPAEVDLPDPTPDDLSCDDFDADPGPLDGRDDGCGNVWSTPSGNWSVSTGVARATGPAALALVDGLATNQVTVTGELIDGHANNRRGGVVHSYTLTDAGPAYLVGYVRGAGRLHLDLVVGNTTISLESVNGVPASSPQLLAVNRSGAHIAVSINGSTLIEHELLPARDGLLSGTGAGLWKAQGPPAEFGSFSVVAG